MVGVVEAEPWSARARPDVVLSARVKPSLRASGAAFAVHVDDLRIGEHQTRLAALPPEPAVSHRRACSAPDVYQLFHLHC
eukprot:3935663-Rhodomonas_salina.2